MKKNLDNRELNIINRFLHGDHEAYSLLYKEHVQELFSYYNRQIKKFPTEKQNVSLKHILT